LLQTPARIALTLTLPGIDQIKTGQLSIRSGLWLRDRIFGPTAAMLAAPAAP
jgi:hypothetical protein